jgi:ribose/xylose/arabinose/galactoside ABC-type transport system permease subunit
MKTIDLAAQKTRNNGKPLLTTEVTVIIAYVLVFAIFAVLNRYFFTVKNLMNILMYCSVLGIAATGTTMILLTGGLDISVGAVIGLSGVISGIVHLKTDNAALALVCGLVTGLLCGSFNGLVITRLKISPLITTLATLSIFRGIALLSTGGLTLLIASRSFKQFGRGYIFNYVPISVIIMAVLFLVFAYLLRSTPFGRRIYSVGGNPEASRLAGINVNRIRFSVYAVGGLVAGMSGVIVASQTGASLPTAGNGAEMQVIGASILGGVSLSGGKGKIVGTLFGILILATLNNGLILMNVQTFWQTIATGCVLLLAVVLDVARGGGYR